MIQSRSLAALVLLVLVLAGCREASIRYNTRYMALLQQPMPKALPIPVDGIQASRLRDTWGYAREGGRRHKGIDIAAPRYTPIRSVTEGVIEFKGMRGLGGQIVNVIGPGGYKHYYAHLEEFGTQAIGDWVGAGEIIGYVGNSGNAAISGPHLHYGIYHSNGQAINPYTYLRKSAPFPVEEPAQQIAQAP